MSKIIIGMTPFIFEDGNTYYFQIYKRPSSNNYHDLYIFEKEIYKTWYGSTKERYIQLNENSELISVKLEAYEIKNEIKKILTGTKASYMIKDWDGFVGDIPEDAKKSLSRDNKLKDLGIK